MGWGLFDDVLEQGAGWSLHGELVHAEKRQQVQTHVTHEKRDVIGSRYARELAEGRVFLARGKPGKVGLQIARPLGLVRLG